MKKKYSIVLTLFILTVAGGVYAWQKIQDPYKGWETYRNDEVGYSVRYPKEYVIDISGYAPGTDLRGNVVLQKLEITDREFPYYIEISITAYDNTDMLSAEKWVEKEIDPYIRPANTQKRTMVKIKGLPGLRLERNKGQSIIVIIQQKEKIFEVTLSGTYTSGKDVEGRRVFERILNSLRID